MKKLVFVSIISISFLGGTGQRGWSQCINRFDLIGKPCGGTIETAVPFLRIIPDARSAAMGDAGIALSADANAMHFNASKLAFAEDRLGIAISYTPWLRNLGFKDIYLSDLAGFFRFGKNENRQQAIGFEVKYFSQGEVQLTDEMGKIIGLSYPREVETAFSYTRQLNSSLALGVTAKYIYSNLTFGFKGYGGIDFIPYADSWAGDFSMTYKNLSLRVDNRQI